MIPAWLWRLLLTPLTRRQYLIGIVVLLLLGAVLSYLLGGLGMSGGQW